MDFAKGNYQNHSADQWNAQIDRLLQQDISVFGRQKQKNCPWLASVRSLNCLIISLPVVFIWERLSIFLSVVSFWQTHIHKFYPMVFLQANLFKFAGRFAVFRCGGHTGGSGRGSWQYQPEFEPYPVLSGKC